MKQSTKVTVLAEITILPGYENEIRWAAENIWLATRKEQGCELFIFNEKKEESTIVFFEVLNLHKILSIMFRQNILKYFYLI